jgi:hypothetical protein
MVPSFPASFRLSLHAIENSDPEEDLAYIAKWKKEKKAKKNLLLRLLTNLSLQSLFWLRKPGIIRVWSANMVLAYFADFSGYVSQGLSQFGPRT